VCTQVKPPLSLSSVGVQQLSGFGRYDLGYLDDQLELGLAGLRATHAGQVVNCAKMMGLEVIMGMS